MSSTNEDRGLERTPLCGVPTPLKDSDIAPKGYVDQFATIQEDIVEDSDNQAISTHLAANILLLRIDGFAAAADLLDNLVASDLGGFPVGTIVIIRSESNARAITIRNAEAGNGQFQMAGAAAFILSTTEDTYMAISDGTNWLELARSDNS